MVAARDAGLKGRRSGATCRGRRATDAELGRVCSSFVRLGVPKLRITGGVPLIRKGILTFFEAKSRHLVTGVGVLMGRRFRGQAYQGWGCWS